MLEMQLTSYSSMPWTEFHRGVCLHDAFFGTSDNCIHLKLGGRKKGEEHIKYYGSKQGCFV